MLKKGEHQTLFLSASSLTAAALQLGQSWRRESTIVIEITIIPNNAVIPNMLTIYINSVNKHLLYYYRYYHYF